MKLQLRHQKKKDWAPGHASSVCKETTRGCDGEMHEKVNSGLWALIQGICHCIQPSPKSAEEMRMKTAIKAGILATAQWALCRVNKC